MFAFISKHLTSIHTTGWIDKIIQWFNHDTRRVPVAEDMGRIMADVLKTPGKPQSDYDRFGISGASDGSAITAEEIREIMGHHGIKPAAEIHTTVTLKYNSETQLVESELMDITAHALDNHSDYLYTKDLPTIKKRLNELSGSQVDIEDDEPGVTSRSKVTDYTHVSKKQKELLATSLISCQVIGEDGNPLPNKDEDEDDQNYILMTRASPDPTNRKEIGYTDWLTKIFSADNDEPAQKIKAYLEHVHPQSPHNNFNFHLISGQKDTKDGSFNIYPGRVLTQTWVVHNEISHETTLIISTYVICELKKEIDGMPVAMRWHDTDSQLEEIDILEDMRKIEAKVKAITQDFIAANETRQFRSSSDISEKASIEALNK